MKFCAMLAVTFGVALDPVHAFSPCMGTTRSPVRFVSGSKQGVEWRSGWTRTSGRDASRRSELRGRDQINITDEDLNRIGLDVDSLSQTEKSRIERLRSSAGMLSEMQADRTSLEDVDYVDEMEIEIMDTDWSGQSGMEIEVTGDKSWTDLTRRPFLAIGDALTLTLFAYIGRASHGMGAFDVGVIITALPFLAGWFGVSPLLGGYTNTATATQGDVVKTLIPAWVLSIPVGIVLRSLAKGEVPPVPFMAVSMGSTLVFLLAWRLFYTAFNPTSDKEYKTAGIFDYFRMVTNLLQRW